MNALVPIALALFVPATYWARSALGPTRGFLAALLGGWLFLPTYTGDVIDVPFLGSKLSFVPTVVLLVSAFTDLERWSRLRLHWVDLAPAALVGGTFLTALSNGLGAREGISAALDATLVWAAPFFLGRLLLGEPRAAREYAVWLAGAGLVYVPLCLWEIRMSPQLHRLVYGYRAAGGFAQAVRWGGYRPSVFMAHGLAVGIFMATAALVAYWLWRSRAVRRIGFLPVSWAAGILVTTTVLIKSTGAIALLAGGVAVLELARALRSPWPLVVLAAVPVLFCAARISGWTPQSLVRTADRLDPDRAASLRYRITNEQALLDKAERRPWLGWGRFGRSRVYDEDGQDVSVTDSLWIILLGVGGIVALGSVGAMLLLPLTLAARKRPPTGDPSAAAAVALCAATSIWALDSLFNSMNAPLYIAASGCLLSVAATPAVRRGTARPQFRVSGYDPARGGGPGSPS